MVVNVMKCVTEPGTTMFQHSFSIRLAGSNVEGMYQKKVSVAFFSNAASLTGLASGLSALEGLVKLVIGVTAGIFAELTGFQVECLRIGAKKNLLGSIACLRAAVYFAPVVHQIATVALWGEQTASKY